MPSGALDDVPAVDVLMSEVLPFVFSSFDVMHDLIFEIPVMFLITVVCVIVLRWAEIHHFAMSAPGKSPIEKVCSLTLYLSTLSPSISVPH